MILLAIAIILIGIAGIIIVIQQDQEHFKIKKYLNQRLAEIERKLRKLK